MLSCRLLLQLYRTLRGCTNFVKWCTGGARGSGADDDDDGDDDDGDDDDDDDDDNEDDDDQLC